MRYWLKIIGRSKRTMAWGHWDISGFSIHMLMKELCGVYLIEAVRVETTENLLFLFILWVSMEKWALSNDSFKERHTRKVVSWWSARNLGLGAVGGCIGCSRWLIWGMLCGDGKGRKTECRSLWILLIVMIIKTIIIAYIHRALITLAYFNCLTKSLDICKVSR